MADHIVNKVFGPIKREEEALPGGMWRVTVTPPAMLRAPGKSVTLNSDQYFRYHSWLDGDGKLLQDALFDLSGQEREVLLNGDPL